MAAFPDLHRTQFFKIESADCSVIFLLYSGHSQTLISWQRTFVIEVFSVDKFREAQFQQK